MTKRRPSVKSLAGKTIEKVELVNLGNGGQYFVFTVDGKTAFTVPYDSLFDGEGNYYRETQGG